MYCMNVIEGMYVCMLYNMTNKQKEWHPATKHLIFSQAVKESIPGEQETFIVGSIILD
jgi:hypothetical protein